MSENEVAAYVVDLAYNIHRQYGPGMFEKFYEEVLVYELEKQGLSVRRQVSVPIVHETLLLKNCFRIDLIVEDKVIVEVKSIRTIDDIHKKQVLTYLRIKDIRLGLLINFNEALIKNGIRRIVNGL